MSILYDISTPQTSSLRTPPPMAPKLRAYACPEDVQGIPWSFALLDDRPERQEERNIISEEHEKEKESLLTAFDSIMSLVEYEAQDDMLDLFHELSCTEYVHDEPALNSKGSYPWVNDFYGPLEFTTYQPPDTPAASSASSYCTDQQEDLSDCHANGYGYESSEIGSEDPFSNYPYEVVTYKPNATPWWLHRVDFGNLLQLGKHTEF